VERFGGGNQLLQWEGTVSGTGSVNDSYTDATSTERISLQGSGALDIGEFNNPHSPIRPANQREA